ncbi:MAG: hypothetical protein RIC93_13790 [Alphaproteobacteria bacterium]
MAWFCAAQWPVFAPPLTPMLVFMAARRINTIKADVVLLETRLAEIVAADPEMADIDRRLRSVPRVGPS